MYSMLVATCLSESHQTVNFFLHRPDQVTVQTNLFIALPDAFRQPLTDCSHEVRRDGGVVARE